VTSATGSPLETPRRSGYKIFSPIRVAVYGPLGKTSAGSAETTVADPVVSTRTLTNMVAHIVAHIVAHTVAHTVAHIVAHMVASVAIIFLILASEVIVSIC
jgi:hypothetical protein